LLITTKINYKAKCIVFNIDDHNLQTKDYDIFQDCASCKDEFLCIVTIILLVNVENK